MASETQGEPSASLIDAAKAAGYSLTENRLARWHRDGLLPRPIVKHLGQGRGTVSLYPCGTTRQLIDLLALRQGRGSLLDVGFRLWLAGYPVSDRYSFDYLRDVAVQYDRIIRRLKEARDRLLSDDDEIQDEAWADLAKISTKRIEIKFVRRIRKRVGRKRFVTFLRIVLDVATGEFEGFSTEYDNPSGSYDDSVLRAALGIMGIKARFLNGALLWLKDPIEQAFINLSHLFGSSTFPDIVDAIDRDRVPDIRGEFWTLLSGIAALANVYKQFSGTRLPGFYGISEIYELADARDLAWMLIAWSRMRQLSWAQDYPKILDALREAGFAPRSARGERHD